VGFADNLLFPKLLILSFPKLLFHDLLSPKLLFHTKSHKEISDFFSQVFVPCAGKAHLFNNFYARTS
jgi:hypothetical protein